MKRLASTSWSWTSLKLPTNKPRVAQSMPNTYRLEDGANEFIHYIRILSSVTMPTCDVLLRHFRKMLLYTQGYAVAYSHLLSTLGLTVYAEVSDRSAASFRVNVETIRVAYQQVVNFLRDYQTTALPLHYAEELRR